MKKILDIFKRKEETDFEVVKSRSNLPMFVIPLPDEINFEIEKDGMDFIKTSLEKLKGRLNGWLDWNMSLSEEKEFHIKEEGKKLTLKVTEKGGTDVDDVTDYYMILESLKDENEMNKEIERGDKNE